MATDKIEQENNMEHPSAHSSKSTKSKKGFVIVVIIVIALLVAGGYFGYRYYTKQQLAKVEKQKQAQEKELEGQDVIVKEELPEPKQSELFQVKIPIEKSITEEDINAQIKQ